MLLKLAYRNIWRNKRRTLITAASIMFAVFFATVMKSIQKGAWSNMLDNALNFHTGYAQISKDAYRETFSIDEAFNKEEALKNLPKEIKGVTGFVPRLQSFALASSGERTKGAVVVGIDPKQEERFTNLSKRLTKGEYLEENDQSILLSEGLAEYLKVSVGDTLIMISQGYHAANAAGKYDIKGIVNFGSPELNNVMSYLPMKQAQHFYATEDRLTSLVVLTDQPDEIKKTVKSLQDKLDGTGFVVQDYEELVPAIIEAKSLDEAGGTVILSILYLIIGFGIFGTLVMMLKERQYEFGILKAIGMHSRKLNIMLWMETIILGFIGCIAGSLLALPLVFYLQYNPIRFTGEWAETYIKFGMEPLFPAQFSFSVFLTQALVVFAMISIMSIYPILKIRKLKPVKAMRG